MAGKCHESTHGEDDCRASRRSGGSGTGVDSSYQPGQCEVEAAELLLTLPWVSGSHGNTT